MEHHNKNRLFIGLLLIMMMVAAMQSCYYDNVEELYPATANCVTDNMSYTNNVWPVINSNCVGCHGGASPSGGIPLKNYDDIAASAAIPAGSYGSLYGTISHSSGNSPMPKNAPKLSDCTISQIKAWIDQGAQDN